MTETRLDRRGGRRLEIGQKPPEEEKQEQIAACVPIPASPIVFGEIEQLSKATLYRLPEGTRSVLILTMRGDRSLTICFGQLRIVSRTVGRTATIIGNPNFTAVPISQFSAEGEIAVGSTAYAFFPVPRQLARMQDDPVPF